MTKLSQAEPSSDLHLGSQGLHDMLADTQGTFGGHNLRFTSY